MADEEKHVWRDGDLCFVKGSEYRGVVWRVIDCSPGGGYSGIFVKPIFSLFSSDSMRNFKTHEADRDKCVFLTLVDLGELRARFDVFLTEEARRRGEGG